jgi:class 3 adenylate cyclase
MVDALGDEVFLVFQAPSAAVSAAVELSNRMGATRWPEDRTVRLRIGVHTGVPDLTSSGYVGLDVHRAARVMAAAHGGQVVATMPVVVSMEPIVGVSLRPLGRYALRGLSEPVTILQVEAAGLATDFPPLRAEPAV